MTTRFLLPGSFASHSPLGDASQVFMAGLAEQPAESDMVLFACYLSDKHSIFVDFIQLHAGDRWLICAESEIEAFFVQKILDKSSASDWTDFKRWLDEQDKEISDDH